MPLRPNATRLPQARRASNSDAQPHFPPSVDHKPSRTILIIDHNAQMRADICDGLKRHGYTVSEAQSSRAGLRETALARPDLIILALDLPDMDSVEMIETIRSWSDVPIIGLSKRSDDAFKVHQFRAGVDDCVVSPPSVEELVARCEVFLRRCPHSANTESIVRTGPVQVDLVSGVVTLDGQDVSLTRKEYRLVQILASHLGLTVTHHQLWREIWESVSTINIQYVRMLVQKVRRKLDCNSGNIKVIVSVSGVGYRMEQHPPVIGKRYPERIIAPGSPVELPINEVISEPKREVVRHVDRSDSHLEADTTLHSYGVEVDPSHNSDRRDRSGAPFNVLVIEDELQIRILLRIGLAAHNYKILEAPDGKTALDLLDKQPDLVILDLSLPDIGGIELLKIIRERAESIPLIALSSRDGEVTKVQSLNLGADDCLTKPFAMDELLARLRLALRHRLQLRGISPIFKIGDLCVDLVQHTVKVRDQEVHLTPKEYELLCVLVHNAGKTVTYKMLLREGWDGLTYMHSLRTFVRRLRKTIEPDPYRPEYILTQAGSGYRLRAVW
jgi:two-component system, OmpR family, KDP operon response regulator KdpE